MKKRRMKYKSHVKYIKCEIIDNKTLHSTLLQVFKIVLTAFNR